MVECPESPKVHKSCCDLKFTLLNKEIFFSSSPRGFLAVNTDHGHRLMYVCCFPKHRCCLFWETLDTIHPVDFDLQWLRGVGWSKAAVAAPGSALKINTQA